MSAEFIRTWNEILSYYSIVLAVLGTICNLIVSAVCMTKSLRNLPTFIFLAVMSITHAFSLYYWNFNNYFLTHRSHFIGDFSKAACRITTFLQMFFLQSSSWLLVALALERYFSVKIRNWRTNIFSSNKAVVVSTGILLFLFLFNFHLNFTLPFTPDANKTISGTCYSTKQYKQWRELHTYIYSVIPFIILAIINSLLIYQIVISNKSNCITTSKRAKNKSVSISVIAFTVSFFLLTGPFAIAGGYFLGIFHSTGVNRSIYYTILSLAFTYHGSDLIILLLTNKKFLYEFNEILVRIKIFKKNKIKSVEATRQTNA